MASDPADMSLFTELDKLPQSWSGIPESQSAINEVDCRRLEVVSFLSRGEFAIPLTNLLQRAKKLEANISFEGLRKILENRDQIPESLREFSFLFPEVQGIANPRLGSMMAVLVFNKEKGWHLEFRLMSRRTERTDRFVRPLKRVQQGIFV
ncbi:MAG: hypothetical protein COU07_01920 [Candidatus Harrisonbacteria bacterium CG10_big_fil_rev_8_21_14_0_10_40_38]|uniref:Uncharacterized protein n=1 Tax=Candidatus Harrisonbacteria bacterium CG10_big_fil_rev_8_21_14_0_10_40_38 TaxID=1974583 RepID=A0A2H0UTA5_9BACT|nr:MAG: hypothetical protein COU07_01920 [Candidatus Harrisonbacteria bacterium CG10_big_fil_rev_8_21_14_0_10_40_38]